jgi:hypothetical protein
MDGVYDLRQNIAGSANFHLFFPFFVGSAAADGSIDKPAKLACLKLPCGACFFLFGRAFFNGPARFLGLIGASSSGEQKKHLPFNMRRHGSPALLVAVYGLDGYPQKLRHLLLRFVQVFPKFCKFLTVHKFPLYFVRPAATKSSRLNVTHRGISCQ